jgi:hypothetical protein
MLLELVLLLNWRPAAASRKRWRPCESIMVLIAVVWW